MAYDKVSFSEYIRKRRSLEFKTFQSISLRRCRMALNLILRKHGDSEKQKLKKNYFSNKPIQKAYYWTIDCHRLDWRMVFKYLR